MNQTRQRLLVAAAAADEEPADGSAVAVRLHGQLVTEQQSSYRTTRHRQRAVEDLCSRRKERSKLTGFTQDGEKKRMSLLIFFFLGGFREPEAHCSQLENTTPSVLSPRDITSLAEFISCLVLGR